MKHSLNVIALVHRKWHPWQAVTVTRLLRHAGSCLLCYLITKSRIFSLIAINKNVASTIVKEKNNYTQSLHSWTRHLTPEYSIQTDPVKITCYVNSLNEHRWTENPRLQSYCRALHNRHSIYKAPCRYDEGLWSERKKSVCSRKNKDSNVKLHEKNLWFWTKKILTMIHISCFLVLSLPIFEIFSASLLL